VRYLVTGVWWSPSRPADTIYNLHNTQLWLFLCCRKPGFCPNVVLGLHEVTLLSTNPPSLLLRREFPILALTSTTTYFLPFRTPKEGFLNSLNSMLSAQGILLTSRHNESRPSDQRRVKFNDDSDIGTVAMVAQCVRHGQNHNTTISLGFALNIPGTESLVLTCAHTLEEASISTLS